MEVKFNFHLLEVCVNCQFNNALIIYFSVGIKARRDTWLLGDTFLRQLWPTIVSSKTKSRDYPDKPFLLQQYNIKSWYSSGTSLTRMLEARVYNQLVNAINEEDYLPHYLIIMLDKDLIEDIHFEGFGCRVLFQDSLYWLASEIQAAFNLRKNDLRGK